MANKYHYLFIVQVDVGYGWEDYGRGDDETSARQQVAFYRKHPPPLERGGKWRYIKRRVLNMSWWPPQGR